MVSGSSSTPLLREPGLHRDRPGMATGQARRTFSHPEQFNELLAKRALSNELLRGKQHRYIDRSWHMYPIGLGVWPHGWTRRVGATRLRTRDEFGYPDRGRGTPADLLFGEHTREESGRFRVCLVALASIGCRNAPHHLIDVLTTTRPRRLSAFLTRDCSAHEPLPKSTIYVSIYPTGYIGRGSMHRSSW